MSKSIPAGRYNAAHNMRQLIIDNNLLLPVISRFDIAFGFGDAPVGEVCRRNGVDTDTFLAVCNFLSGYPYDVADISLHSLMGYLRHAHKSFLNLTLPRIRHQMIEAINHSATDEVALLLIRFFDDYVAEVRKHMDYENDVVFTYVDSLLEGKPRESFSISDFSGGHGHMATKLRDLKDIFIYHYNQKDNDRLSSTLFEIITCERDMMSHFEVERHLFIPAVEMMEKSVAPISASHEDDSSDDAASDSPSDALSDREKEIVRCVALGKSNKEIADELCISAHTVATHRKNISAKLNIHSTAGITIFAILHGILDINSLRAPEGQ